MFQLLVSSGEIPQCFSRVLFACIISVGVLLDCLDGGRVGEKSSKFRPPKCPEDEAILVEHAKPKGTQYKNKWLRIRNKIIK